MRTIGYTNKRYYIEKDHAINGISKSRKRYTDHGFALRLFRRVQKMNKDMLAIYRIGFEYDKEITV